MDNGTIVDEQVADTEIESQSAPGEWVALDRETGEWTRLPSVQQAISAAMRAMKAVGRNSRNTFHNFNYQSIYDLMDAMHGPFAQAGLVVMFRPLRDTLEYFDRATGREGSMHYVRGFMEFRFIGPRGDELITEVLAEGADGGDKGLAKFHTAAYKTMLRLVFCVPTKDIEDADGESATGDEQQDGAAPPTGELPKNYLDGIYNVARGVRKMDPAATDDYVQSMMGRKPMQLTVAEAKQVIDTLKDQSVTLVPPRPPAAPTAPQNGNQQIVVEVTGDNGEVIGVTRPPAQAGQPDATLAHWKEQAGLAVRKIVANDDRKAAQFGRAYIGKSYKDASILDFQGLTTFAEWFRTNHNATGEAESFIENPKPILDAYANRHQPQPQPAAMPDDAFDAEPDTEDFDAMFPQGETHAPVPPPQAAQPQRAPTIRPPVPRKPVAARH